MRSLSTVGRIFFGIAIAAMGFLTIYNKDFPYMMLPPNHSWMNEHVVFIYVSGAILFLAGAGIVFNIKPTVVPLLLGCLLLLVFCFYFIPYQLMVSPNRMHYGDWENAAKEFGLASGAIVISGCYRRKLFPFGTILFALTIFSFGIDHMVYGKEAMDYIPSWIPGHLFWIYFCGAALLGSSLAILLNIRRRLFAALLGGMILIWVIILHTPKAIADTLTDHNGEVSSGFLALAYCGIAFVIAGRSAKATS